MAVESFEIRCLFCGVFSVDASSEVSAVEQLHAHTDSESHRALVALDRELNALHYLGG